MASSEISRRNEFQGCREATAGPCPGWPSSAPQTSRSGYGCLRGLRALRGWNGVSSPFLSSPPSSSSSLLGMKVANCPGPARGTALTPWREKEGGARARPSRFGRAPAFCSPSHCKKYAVIEAEARKAAPPPEAGQSPGLLSPFSPPRSLGGATPCQLCTC